MVDSTILDVDQVRRCLDMVQEIRASEKVFDVHVHPFEMFVGGNHSKPSATYPGVYSANGREYQPPSPLSVRLNMSGEQSMITNAGFRRAFAMNAAKNRYHHVGPRVFLDHMDLGCVDYAFLLPVARANPADDPPEILEAMLYGDEKRLLCGLCVPNHVPDGSVLQFLKTAMERRPFFAVKVHPNVSMIDLTTPTGRNRIEIILAACDAFGLPVIIHGGRSFLMEGAGASEFAVMGNLARIDWGISRAMVVIAHAGAYDCDLKEVEDRVLPVLSESLDRFDNLRVDASNLPLDVMAALLRRLDLARILFGSDALYEPPYVAVAKTIHVMNQVGMKTQQAFAQIACKNPRDLLSGKDQMAWR